MNRYFDHQGTIITKGDRLRCTLDDKVIHIVSQLEDLGYLDEPSNGQQQFRSLLTFVADCYPPYMQYLDNFEIIP